MHINPKLIKNQFEKSIDKYNQNAIVQKITAEKLVLETAKINQYFENILEPGCGAGLLTNELVKHIKFKRYFANDLVEKSKYYVSKIIPDAIFYCGNAKHIKPSKKISRQYNKFAKTKIGKPVATFLEGFKDGLKTIYKDIRKGLKYIWNKIKGVKKSTYEKAVVNTVGTSGGIASGVTALKETQEKNQRLNDYYDGEE